MNVQRERDLKNIITEISIPGKKHIQIIKNFPVRKKKYIKKIYTLQKKEDSATVYNITNSIQK